MIGLLCFALAALVSSFTSNVRLGAESGVVRRQLFVCTRGVHVRVRLIQGGPDAPGAERYNSKKWIVSMRRTAAVIGTAIFFVFVPCVVAGVVPWWISHWEFRLSFLGVELTRFVGAALILAGVAGLVDSFARFALPGLGTPAPIAPPH